MTRKQYKILSLGSGQSNFLLQQYGEMKRVNTFLEFSIDNYRDISTDTVSNNSFFNAHHQFNKTSLTQKQVIISLFKLLFVKTFWQFLFFELRTKTTLKNLKTTIKQQSTIKHMVDKEIVPLDYHIYHFHFCSIKNLQYLHYLPKTVNTICSFWGSDLYRNNSPRVLFYVRKALEKTKAITIQTPEMGTHLMEKYGFDLRPKITYARFALERTIYDNINAYKNDKTVIEAFKESIGVALDKIVVVIGYSAVAAFNHIEIIQTLISLSTATKNKICIILPLTYQRNDVYLNSLKITIAKSKDLEILTLENYLSNFDIAKLRLSTDIQIQMPVSDALSGSVTEVLYAGNSLIAGDWLPYTYFKEVGLHFDTVSNYKELLVLLENMVNNMSTQKLKNAKNPTIVRNNFFPEQTVTAWLELYQNLLK